MQLSIKDYNGLTSKRVQSSENRRKEGGGRGRSQEQTPLSLLRIEKDTIYGAERVREQLCRENRGDRKRIPCVSCV